MKGTELRELRTRYDLSQTETALLLGVTQPTISLWESEDYSIPSIVAWVMRHPKVVKMLRAEPAGA